LSIILSHINYGNIVFTIADSASQRRLGIEFKACLRYIHMRRRLDHVSHLESTVLCWLIMPEFSFCRFYTGNCMFVNRHPSYLFLLFASLYVCYESVICGPGLQGVEFSAA
jgi:hypothetical protein